MDSHTESFFDNKIHLKSLLTSAGTCDD